jgi:hypothetical protein
MALSKPKPPFINVHFWELKFQHTHLGRQKHAFHNHYLIKISPFP